eukprot:5893783-Amphidinium_carterae.1
MPTCTHHRSCKVDGLQERARHVWNQRDPLPLMCVREKLLSGHVLRLFIANQVFRTRPPAPPESAEVAAALVPAIAAVAPTGEQAFQQEAPAGSASEPLPEGEHE